MQLPDEFKQNISTPKTIEKTITLFDSELTNKKIILHHGSKGGIKGKISPISRDNCDFGQGFYTGSFDKQVKSLVSSHEKPFYYKLALDLSKFDKDKILILKDDDWLYYVLFCRKKLESISHLDKYSYYQNLAKDKDLIIGVIADDNMNNTIRNFMENNITDVVAKETLSAINYGIQYVAKTQFACDQFEILQESLITGKHLLEMSEFAKQRSAEGKNIEKQKKIQFFGKGNLFDNILLEWEREGFQK